MITDEEIEQLPEDPDLAFVEFEKLMRARTTNKVAETDRDDESYSIREMLYLEYINKVLAAARAYKIDGLKDWEVPKVDSNCWEAYRQFTSDVDFFTMQIRIGHADRNRKNSVGLDGNTKAKIHSYVQKIRSVLDIAELPEEKRDLLFTKLDAFVVEVDKARTSLQAVASVYLSVCTVIGEGFNKLQPVRRFIDSIAALIGKAKEAEDGLRGLPYSTKQLESPRKLLPAPQPDEEEPSDFCDVKPDTRNGLILLALLNVSQTTHYETLFAR
jgi:hypothetical protein